MILISSRENETRDHPVAPETTPGSQMMQIELGPFDGVEENTHYSYQIRVENTVGSNSSIFKEFCKLFLITAICIQYYYYHA